MAFILYTTAHAYRDICDVDEKEYRKKPVEFFIQFKAFCLTKQILQELNNSFQNILPQRVEPCTFTSLEKMEENILTNQLAICLKRDFRRKSNDTVIESIGYSAEDMLKSVVFDSETVCGTKNVEKLYSKDPQFESFEFRQCTLLWVLEDIAEFVGYKPYKEPTTTTPWWYL